MASSSLALRSSWLASYSHRSGSAPRARPWAWKNSNLNVYAPPQTYRGNRYVFRDWSDGKGNRHAIAVPEDSRRYVAGFRRR